MSGDGMSGLPKPRSITSRPARRASIFRVLMIVKTYGGRFSMRLNGMPRRYRCRPTRSQALPARPGSATVGQGGRLLTVSANSWRKRSALAAGEGGADGAGVLAEDG